MEPTIIPTKKAHDLLALIPHLVGFEPTDAIVLVAFRGKRTGGAFRLDLPAVATDRVYERVATTVIGMVCKVRGADGVVPVVYTADAFADSGGIPRDRLVHAVLDRAESAGFVIKEALCVAADGWGSYLDVDHPGPLPLSLIADSPVKDALARTQSEYSSTRGKTPAERARLPQVDPADTERTARAIVAAERGKDADAFGSPIELAEAALDWSPTGMTHQQVANLVLAAADACTRDVLLYDWSWGESVARTAHELNERHARGELVTADDDGALALAGMGMPRPDPARMHVAMDVLRHAAAAAPGARRAPLLTMLAWLHWALGSGSTAGILVRRARALDPAYGFAELLQSMLDAAMLPEWAFDDEVG